MVKEIIWSRLAHQNRIEILEYYIIRNQSVSYSLKLNQIFIETVELISKYPRIGKKTNYPNVRVKVVKHYLFTYRETLDAIEIITIWDARQDPRKFENIIK